MRAISSEAREDRGSSRPQSSLLGGCRPQTPCERNIEYRPKARFTYEFVKPIGPGRFLNQSGKVGDVDPTPTYLFKGFGPDWGRFPKTMVVRSISRDHRQTGRPSTSPNKKS